MAGVDQGDRRESRTGHNLKADLQRTVRNRTKELAQCIVGGEEVTKAEAEKLETMRSVLDVFEKQQRSILIPSVLFSLSAAAIIALARLSASQAARERVSTNRLSRRTGIMTVSAIVRDIEKSGGDHSTRRTAAIASLKVGSFF